MNGFRTWVEIDKKALQGNMEQFLKLIPEKTRLMAVVKSNAYGHGFTLVAKLLANFQFKIFPPKVDLRQRRMRLGSTSQADNFQKIWFGVDSITEALALRREGIKNPILVLGSTLPILFAEAIKENIIVTISNFASLAALGKTKNRPVFHIKIDTGMHRQGFLPKDIFKLIKILKRFKLSPQGIYTHFAAAKDIAYPSYTLAQLEKFKSVVSEFRRAGFTSLIRHAAASGGTLLFPESHLDMARIGMSLYGYFPSLEAKLYLQDKVKLKPVLAWKMLIAEIKEIPAGSYVGYDLTEKVSRKTKIAVLPIGYWHGYDRGLSGIGEVLIRGRRAKVLGRVSMDMIVVDITDINNKFKAQSSKVKTGSEVVLIGRQGKEEIWADELALKIGTSQYEFLTRINPLIKRVVK